MREMLLLEEHMNLDSFSVMSEHLAGDKLDVRDKSLPGILSQYSNTLESSLKSREDLVFICPFTVQSNKIDIELEIIIQPLKSFPVAFRKKSRCWLGIWKDSTVIKRVGRLTQADYAVL